MSTVYSNHDEGVLSKKKKRTHDCTLLKDSRLYVIKGLTTVRYYFVFDMQNLESLIGDNDSETVWKTILIDDVGLRFTGKSQKKWEFVRIEESCGPLINMNGVSSTTC